MFSPAGACQWWFASGVAGLGFVPLLAHRYLHYLRISAASALIVFLHCQLFPDVSNYLCSYSRIRPAVTLHTHRPDGVSWSACVPQVFSCGLSPAGDYLDPRPAASSTLPPVSCAAEPAPGLFSSLHHP